MTVEVSDETARWLEEQAAKLGLTPEAVFVQLIEDNLSESETPTADGLADYLLDKNQELYRKPS